MSKQTICFKAVRLCYLSGLGGSLLLLLYLLLPSVALAQSPETCADCHETEIDAWQNSLHAGTADSSVTCESCHGPYVEDHPQKGVMQLGVDSTVCRDCHDETHRQWQHSSHGQANVQCISCHLSHSQEFRLTDEALCQSCHREELNDFAHTTHAASQLPCTDCHLSSASRELTGQAQVAAAAGGGTPPNHSFIVLSKACIDCHEQEAEQSAFIPVNRQIPPDAQIPELKAELKSAEQANQSLKGMSVATLGMGLGIGGMLGIIFVLIAGRLSQGSMHHDRSS